MTSFVENKEPDTEEGPEEETECLATEQLELSESSIELETEQPQQPVSLLFAGDVYLSGYVTENYDNEGITGVLDETLLSEMQSADICMINEEFPFGTTGTPAEDKQFTFRLHPSYISVFEDMGVDIVSLANNHVLDYGKEPLQETLQVLNENEILYAGAGKDLADASALRTITVGKEDYGFLSASRVIPVTEWDVRNAQPGVFTTYDETLLIEAIKKAKESCDFLTVYVHWGIERNTTPEEYQKQLAHAYIDAGADLVIGAHPHVLQGIEAYNGKMIFYSLGNFIFNQSIEKTMLVKVTKEENAIEYSILPAYATGAKTNVLAAEQEAFYSYLESLSYGVTIEDGKIGVKE
ncbi:MAG: CapA family protein [Lachnospiraceae bacterium]|nr:CapA family protein [Lachnospiraceae bacterium]